MRPLTLVLPHYRNLGMLAEQHAIWADYPADLKAALHVIVVDDASPKEARPTHKMMPKVGLASSRLYRIVPKVRWNWLACRNLGVEQASTEWVLMTDMDHAMPSETLRRLVEGDLQPADVYRLSRVDAVRRWPYPLSACPPYKVHPNTWLMTRSMFLDRVGGYDERLSGCYGTDGEFRARVASSARAVVTLPEVVIRYPRQIIADASTLPELYTRKGDATNDTDLTERRLKRDRIANWTPLRLTFPWEQVV